jgi:hypothetical protein
MALFCKAGRPVGYNDNDNSKIQTLSSTQWGNQKCLFIGNEGLTNIWPNYDSQIQDFDNEISGFRVRPGYKLSTYWKSNGQELMGVYEATNEGKDEHLNSTMNDWIDSIKLEKVCSLSYWTWDDSCAPHNFQHRKTVCEKNLNAHPRCREFCNINKNACDTAITDYCNNLPIDVMINDNFCKTGHSQRIKGERCPTKSELFGTAACKNYCQINPNQCKESVQNYCTVNNFNNANKACKEFCVEDNIPLCMSAIKNYCKGNTIKSDPWCQTTLVHPKMRGLHDTEMQNYCNGIGKQRNLVAVGEQKNLNIVDATADEKSKEILDRLENPICACFDNNLINKKFDHVKNEKYKPMFTSRPQCFYSNCISDSNAYKKTSPDPCKITICSIDAENINIKESTNVKIENNCGGGGGGTVTNPYTPSQSDGTPSTGAGSNNKIDCQMTKWSECSNKCIAGIETREWVVGPLNGGEPCGPTSRECKIQCTTIKDQLLNSYFNFNDLDQTNKIILIVIVILIIIILIIFMLPNNQNNPQMQMPYSPQMQMPYSPQMQMPYSPQMQMPYRPQMQMPYRPQMQN